MSSETTSTPNVDAEILRTDVAIIGAGPVGLFAVFELGLLGLNAVLIDSLDKPGGQCAELYPEKPIYDIPAWPVITGQELTDRLVQQAAPFNPVLRMGEQVESLEKHEDSGLFRVTGNGGSVIEAAAVFIAAGAGSFTPRKPKLAGLDALEGRSVFYAVRDKAALAGRDIVIAGGGDSALDWALDLYPNAGSLTLVHRSERFRAAPHSVEAMRQAVQSGAMRFVQGELSALVVREGALRAVEVRQGDSTLSIVADRLLPFFGLDIKLGPIVDWQLDLEAGKQIKVDTEQFQTSTPGVFAVGDINHYPGKLKLILSGFHEVALAARSAFKLARPDERLRFQYTTSSSELHKRLKVA